MNLTEKKLNDLLDYLQKSRGELPSFVTSVYFIKNCNKAELKQLARKLNIKITHPENNYLSKYYSLTVDPSPNERILMESEEVKFEYKEVEDEN